LFFYFFLLQSKQKKGSGKKSEDEDEAITAEGLCEEIRKIDFEADPDMLSLIAEEIVPKVYD
jgi:hypothetical protein